MIYSPKVLFSNHKEISYEYALCSMGGFGSLASYGFRGLRPAHRVCGSSDRRSLVLVFCSADSRYCLYFSELLHLCSSYLLFVAERKPDVLALEL